MGKQKTPYQESGAAEEGKDSESATSVTRVGQKLDGGGHNPDAILSGLA